MKDHPKVTIITVNWNGEKCLKDCLLSVFNQTYPNYEVILVDNASTDSSVKYVKEKFPEVKVIVLNKNIGFGAAVNAGIKQSNSKYVVTLDNDTKVEPKWLEELLKVAELNEQVGSCQPKMLSLDDPKIIDALGISITKNGGAIQVGYETEDTGQHNQVKEVFGACSGSALYKRDMLTQVGLFDEDFFAYCDDIDLALRARLAGWKCMYVPKAVVYHKHSATYGRGSSLKVYFLGRNSYYYIIKNLPTDIMFKFLREQAQNIIRTILSIIKRAILRDIKGIRLRSSYLKANFDAIKNIPEMFKKRKKIHSARPISDEELIKWFDQ